MIPLIAQYCLGKEGQGVWEHTLVLSWHFPQEEMICWFPQVWHFVGFWKHFKDLFHILHSCLWLPLTLRKLVLMETYLTKLLGCKHHQSSNAQIKYPVFFVGLFFFFFFPHIWLEHTGRHIAGHSGIQVI